MHAYIYMIIILQKQYDYFFIFVGDDTYVIVDNLREFLLSKQVQDYQKQNSNIFYTGFWIYRERYHKKLNITSTITKQVINTTTTTNGTNTTTTKTISKKKIFSKPPFYYMGGGSGYVMSSKTQQLFVENALSNCNPYVYRDDSAEDVHTSSCLRTHVNITRPYDSRDCDINDNDIDDIDMDNNNNNNDNNNSVTTTTRDNNNTSVTSCSHRFHQLNVEVHSTIPNESKVYKYQTPYIKRALNALYENEGWPIVYKQDYISKRSIAFHKHYYPFILQRLDHLLYNTYEKECNEILLLQYQNQQNQQQQLNNVTNN